MHFFLNLFFGIVAVQLFYYVFVFAKFAFHKDSLSREVSVPPISVIICIKNQASFLKQNLDAFLNQKHPVFEIVLIDDASSDNSLEIIEEYAAQHPNIKIVKVENIEAFWGNKKFALTLGIKAAKYDHLLFTSIESQPKSSQWIKEMARKFSKEKTIILGHVSYEKIKNSPLNYLYRFEKVLNSTSTFGWLKLGRAYQGDGKNLAYHRSEFFRVRGFNDHMKIRFGEDILFVNQASETENTSFTYHEESTVLMNSPKRFSLWFNEKRNKQATFAHIRWTDQLQLKLFNISQVLFVTFSILLLIFHPNWKIVLGGILIRYIISWTILGLSAKNLSEKDLIIWYPILEIGWIFTRINMLFTNFFSKPNP